MVTIFDLEADRLLRTATKIWVASWKHHQDLFSWENPTGDLDSLRDERLFFDTLNDSDIVVGHNIKNYDLPLLKRLYGFILPKRVEVIDTIVWSRLFYPDLKVPEGWKGKPQPHSLEAWMMRMGMEPKVQWEDWSKFDPVMVERCRSDVLGTEQLYLRLREEYEKNGVGGVKQT